LLIKADGLDTRQNLRCVFVIHKLHLRVIWLWPSDETEAKDRLRSQKLEYKGHIPQG